MNITPLPQDKANHVIYGAVIFTIVLLIVQFAKIPHSTIIGLAVVALFAGGKEVADSKNPDRHTADLMDCAATIAGGAFMALSVYLARTL